MAKEDEYLSYEQVLHELQINRGQLNDLIREGHLKEHIVSGETKFRHAEVSDLKGSIEKRPTVMADEEEKRPTDVLGDGDRAEDKEPETELLEEEEGETERETDLLEEVPAGAERETEVLEDDDEFEFELEPVGTEEEGEVERPLSEESSASESTLETELDLEAVREAGAEEESEIFDFSDTLEEDFQLEGEEEEELVAPAEIEEDEELITDILEPSEEEVPEEDLLSEIMDIEEEEEPAGAGADLGDEEITADITTMEEPTFEPSELEEGLGLDEEAEDFGDEFAVPTAAPLAGGRAQSVGAGWVVLLVITLVALAVGGICLVENAYDPGYTAGLLSWLL